jgi:predicted GNAT family acetyltransferase
MLRTERLSSAHEAAALRYLSRAPYDNVFLSYLILFDVAPVTRNAIYAALDGDDVCGVAYFGRQVALAADSDPAIEAFAKLAERHRGERMLLGPREIVLRYWDLVAPWHVAPRVVRDRQFVMTIDRPALRPYDHSVVVRRARIEEWTTVADNSAMMIEQELEYDPRRASPEFAANVRAMIERGLWWVGESLGRLCFFCNVGPWSSQTAQLQGIWTPPDLRGRGLAAASLGATCDRLLSMSPTLSLYVNSFNRPAIALYERTGFTTTSEFATILF